jgi:hypothetical protein
VRVRRVCPFFEPAHGNKGGGNHPADEDAFARDSGKAPPVRH